MPNRRETREEIGHRIDPRRLLVPLSEDLDAVLTTLRGDKASQFARRTYVRALATFVEAWINAVKRVCFEAASVAIQPFTQAELALLRDVGFDLNEKGEAVESTKFLKVDRNFRFTFAAYAKLMGSDLRLKVDQNGWELFRQFIRLRNRLTHPREASELTVTDEELERAEKAGDWFMSVTTELWADAEKSYRIKRERHS